jgi:glycosyltransferase involved in cell wall biosynthesis
MRRHKARARSEFLKDGKRIEMRLLFALPGFHRYDRGAEVALLAVARELALGGDEVTVAGSGHQREGVPYRFLHVSAVRRERFERLPSIPAFRDETAWEDATFAAALLARYRPGQYDATVTCSFPHSHWVLRRPAADRPAHFFVTQNGDWPARTNGSEYRFFGCEGLVCTNPDYFEANEARWNCALIPNGIDLDRFSASDGGSDREAFGLPAGVPIVLMVSALIPSKRVLAAIRALAGFEDAFLVVAGDGPERDAATALAADCLPGRFKRISIPAAAMPHLYRAADVFLHMSDTEPFGNVYLEAWASGLPIVAHDSARLRWILGDDQYLCDTHDSDALLAQLRSAILQGARASREGLARFAWPVVAGKYRAFIAQTLAAGAT